MPEPKKTDEKVERPVHSTTTASASRAELTSERAAERAQERADERVPERSLDRTSDDRSSDRPSGPLARAGESGDPDVHFLMAQRQTHQSVLDALDDPTADRTRQEARDAIKVIDDRLSEMGYEVG